jgi:hypothetical protein
MSVIIKIYQSKMINEVLTAASFSEVKNNIDTTFLNLKKQSVSENEIMALVEETLQELKSLNQSRLPYHQYANIISAKVHLRELQLQLLNVIN